MKSLSKRLIVGSLVTLFSFSSHAALIDLNSWVEEGNPANGNWTVAADGQSVFQSVNGQPSYFVSQDSFINSEFSGSFGVETTGDDDFIGFVFGFNNTNDYYLFDWKQSNQSTASEGFTLSKISNESNTDFWGHTGTGINVLGTSYGSNRGWADNTVYEFTLGYTDSEINIAIDGGAFDNEQIFSFSGLTNQAGRFGFYNYSQQSVRYSGFTEDVCTQNCGSVDVPEPASIAILGLGLAALGLRRKRS